MIIRCPSCKKTISVISFGGKVTCPKCHKPFRIRVDKPCDYSSGSYSPEAIKNIIKPKYLKAIRSW